MRIGFESTKNLSRLDYIIKGPNIEMEKKKIDLDIYWHFLQRTPVLRQWTRKSGLTWKSKPLCIEIPRRGQRSDQGLFITDVTKTDKKKQKKTLSWLEQSHDSETIITHNVGGWLSEQRVVYLAFVALLVDLNQPA